MAASLSERVRAHRRNLRAAGLRPDPDLGT
ncbi:antitoxin MazE-like protein [Caballeronia udeis]